MECMRERLEEVIPGHLQLVVVYSCGMDYGTMEMECMRERLEEVRGEAGRGVGAETDPHSTQQDEAFCCCGGQPIWPTDGPMVVVRRWLP